jgi:hypothetical protein
MVPGIIAGVTYKAFGDGFWVQGSGFWVGSGSGFTEPRT